MHVSEERQARKIADVRASHLIWDVRLIRRLLYIDSNSNLVRLHLALLLVC
jgi:hypothetical protein